MDPYGPADRRHLFEAIKHHWKVLSVERKRRAQLIRKYAGSSYGADEIRLKDERETVLNLMLQTAEAHMLSLAGGNPRYNITAKSVQGAGFATRYKIALNNLVQEIHLVETIRACALDSFFGPAWCKIYLEDAALVEIESDVWMDPGQPFAARVSPEDFVFDTEAQHFRKVLFAGDRYRIPFEDVAGGDTRFEWTEKHEEAIRPTTRRDMSEKDELARQISRGERPDDGEYEPMVDLVDLWLPREGLVVTWAVRDKMELIDTDPLSAQEWDGLESGPYHMLNLGPVPDNMLPTSPAQNVEFLFELTNSIYRKLAVQAKRQKEITAVEEGAQSDGAALRDAQDGDMVTLHRLGAHGVFRLGGIDQEMAMWGERLINLGDRMGGNVSSRLGLGPSSETVGQDRMIMGQVGRSEAYMQQKMVDFAAELGAHLAYLLFTDPAMELPGKQKIDFTDYEVDAPWVPEDREGDFNDYDYKLEPYSLAYQSPSDRAMKLRQFMSEMVPLMPILQQMGWEIDLSRYLQIQADLLDSPQLLEVFRPAGPPPEMQQGGGGHQATQSPVTSRETIRRSESGGQQTPGAQAQQALQGMGAAGGNGRGGGMEALG